MFAKSATRVRDHTPDHLNFRILDRTADNVARYSEAGREEIHHRLDQLDSEWDIERVLMTQASGLALTGLVLGRLKSRGFYLFSGAVLSFLLQHSLQGWCPPIRVLRALGFRTPREIEEERHALLQALEKAPRRLRTKRPKDRSRLSGGPES